jgi:hypothetical protein
MVFIGMTASRSPCSGRTIGSSSRAPTSPADPEFRDSSFSVKGCHRGGLVVAQVAYRPVGRQLRAPHELPASNIPH